MDDFDFLTFDDILEIHARVLLEHGGADGILNRNVIESAIAQPFASMGGQFLHSDITLMAAAYLYHLASQQGFQDGNKRTAVVAAIEFLGRNGYQLEATDLEVYSITMQIAGPDQRARPSKQEIADWIVERLVPNP